MPKLGLDILCTDYHGKGSYPQLSPSEQDLLERGSLYYYYGVTGSTFERLDSLGAIRHPIISAWVRNDDIAIPEASGVGWYLLIEEKYIDFLPATSSTIEFHFGDTSIPCQLINGSDFSTLNSGEMRGRRRVHIEGRAKVLTFPNNPEALRGWLAAYIDLNQVEAEIRRRVELSYLINSGYPAFLEIQTEKQILVARPNLLFFKQLFTERVVSGPMF